MRTRLNYQIACPACHANIGRPCRNKEGQRLNGVHWERTRALRRETFAALKLMYAPLPTHIAGSDR